MQRNAVPRVALTAQHRAVIFNKTSGHCHVCGELLQELWCADHVVPHALGGSCVEDNFLPACASCNRLRWCIPPDQLRESLEVGIFLSREVRRKSKLGLQVSIYCDARRKGNARRRKKLNEVSNVGENQKTGKTVETTVISRDLEPQQMSATQVVEVIQCILAEPTRRFVKHFKFGGKAVLLTYEPEIRKSFPLQFRAEGVRTFSSGIGAYELNQGLIRFFRQLTSVNSEIPQMSE